MRELGFILAGFFIATAGAAAIIVDATQPPRTLQQADRTAHSLPSLETCRREHWAKDAKPDYSVEYADADMICGSYYRNGSR